MVTPHLICVQFISPFPGNPCLFSVCGLSSPTSREVQSLGLLLLAILNVNPKWLVESKGQRQMPWQEELCNWLCSWSVLFFPGCWQHKKTGRGRMPCSWRTSAGGKGAAHKAHQCVSERHVPMLYHEAGGSFQASWIWWYQLSRGLGKMPLFPVCEFEA